VIPSKFLKESHRIGDAQWVVQDGVFSYNGIKFYTRSGIRGRCDLGIVMGCIDRDGFSYWHLGEPYTGIVVDLGAHIGGFTCAVAKTAKHVYAYEASTENYDLLVRNVELNNLGNVTCFRRAAGDGEPVKITGFGSADTVVACLPRKGRGFVEEVPGVSLEEIVQTAGGDIELLKMDCEGGEYDLFLGQSRGLVRSIEMMATELHHHPHHGFLDLIQYVTAFGYKTYIHASQSDSCRMADFWRFGK